MLTGSSSPHIAELIAIRKGILAAISHGCFCFIMESDALNADNSLAACNPFCMENNIAVDIRLLNDNNLGVSIQYCSRHENNVCSCARTYVLKLWFFSYFSGCYSYRYKECCIGIKNILSKKKKTETLKFLTCLCI